MLIREIIEGGSLDLNEEHLNIAKAMKQKKPTSPFSINNNSLVFDEYIVGELVLKDLSIKLKPRNDAFNLSSYFEIIHYLYQLDKFDDLAVGLSDSTESLSVRSLSRGFCDACRMLMQFGLTGDYITSSDYGQKISGKLDFDEFKKQLIPINGVPFFDSHYSLNTAANQLIKAVLNRLVIIDGANENLEKYQFLRNMTTVSELDFTKEEAYSVLSKLYSPNPWYIAAIELGIKILFTMDIEYSDGSIEWLSFLENSNSLFESYIRKALQDNLGESVIKWDKPKPFLYLRSSLSSGKKEFSPDILINFNTLSMSADAIIDVKNKVFEPSSLTNLDSVVSTSDLYQLIFYCNQLNSRVGGLVYPSSTNNDPIEVMFDNKNDLKLYIFSVNIKQNLIVRNKLLSEQIYDKLLREI